jgi:hypothetical protein
MRQTLHSKSKCDSLRPVLWFRAEAVDALLRIRPWASGRVFLLGFPSITELSP